MDRMVQRNVLATSGRAVEAAGDCSTLLSSTADETPEGRSIVDFARERLPVHTVDLASAELVPFTAQTRMGGIDLPPDGDGLAANTTWYDVTLGLSMLIGRFAPIVLALVIAGSLADARVDARTRATLDTSGLTFAGFLAGVIVIVGGLIYFPMVMLGPIGERITG
jgi:Potassium-transporting ATPase A subunit